MGLKQRLMSDLTSAMKAQEALRTSTLRMAKAALQNREIEKGGELDEEEMAKLFRSLVKQRHDSVEQYEKGGRQELADKEKAEIEILEIQEEALGEAADLGNERAPAKHEAAADDRDPLQGPIVQQLAHLVALQPRAKAPFDRRRREAAKQKVKDRWVALAEMQALA